MFSTVYFIALMEGPYILNYENKKRQIVSLSFVGPEGLEPSTP